MLLCLLLSTSPRALDSSLFSYLIYFIMLQSVLYREKFFMLIQPPSASYPARFMIIITIILHLLIASARFWFARRERGNGRGMGIWRIYCGNYGNQILFISWQKIKRQPEILFINFNIRIRTKFLSLKTFFTFFILYSFLKVFT